MFGDLDDADSWVDGWQAAAERRAEQARELSARVAALRAVARSADGLVEVTVSGDGMLTDLRLDDRIRSQSGARTSAQVLSMLRQAQAELAGKVADAAGTVMGDSETARAIIHSYQQRFPTVGNPDQGR
jgi:DNA-binding protein YbaB